MSRLSNYLNSRNIFIGIAVLVALLLISLMVAGFVSGDRIGRQVHEESGVFDTEVRAAPDFDLVDVNGNRISLSSLSGKLVFVDFWSSWCAVCRLEADGISRSYDKWRDQNVEYVGVAIWDQEDHVKEYIDEYSIEFPVAIQNSDSGQLQLQVSYGVTGIPEKFFITPDGNLVRRIIGPTDEDDLNDIIEELLEKYPA